MLESVGTVEFDPASLLMVIFVDLILSGDNAIVIGMAAASLPAEMRKTAIAWGIGIAIFMRVIFAISALTLMQITGLKLFGGLLLLWVCYRLWIDLVGEEEDALEAELAQVQPFSATMTAPAPQMSFWSSAFLRAMTSILIADVSMSLDNILAVAGVAKDNMLTLVFGLVLSIAMMAIAATAIAKVLETHRWIGYVGLAIIVWVAGEMIFHGAVEVQAALR